VGTGAANGGSAAVVRALPASLRQTLIDAVATHDPATGRTAIFLVNRSQTDDAVVTIDTATLGAITVLSSETLADTDVTAKNTLKQPDRVALASNESAIVSGGTVTVTLPAVSWTAIELG